MPVSTFFALTLGFIVFVLLLRSVNVVPQYETRIVERLGRYARTLEPGLHLLVPVVDHVAAAIDMREQELQLDSLAVQAAHAQPLTVDLTVAYTVSDPVRANYQVASLVGSLEGLARASVNDWTSQRTVAQVHDARGELAGAVQSRLEGSAAEWGLHIGAVRVSSIELAAAGQESLPRGPLDPAPRQGPFLG